MYLSQKLNVITMKILSTLFLVLTTTLAFAGGTDLILNLESGKTYTVSSDMSMKYFKDASLSEKVMTSNIQTKASIKVLSKTSDGVHTVEVDFISMILNQDMGGMQITYDSENPDPNNPMTAMIEPQLKPLLESTLTVMVNKYGEVIEQTGGAEGSMVDLSSMVNNLFIKYPKEEISKGYSWNNDLSQAAAGIGIKAIYTVNEFSKSEVTLGVKTEVDTEQSEELKDAETKGGGSMLIDAKTGWVKESEMNMTMKGSSPQMGEFFMVTKVTQKTL